MIGEAVIVRTRSERGPDFPAKTHPNRPMSGRENFPEKAHPNRPTIGRETMRRIAGRDRVLPGEMQPESPPGPADGRPA